MVLLCLGTSIVFGLRASLRWLIILGAGGGLVLLTRSERWLLRSLLLSALLVPLEFNTGTEVQLNTVTLLTPAIFGLWLLRGLRNRKLDWATAPTNRPLLLFLLAGLFSILVGNVFWDPAIPKSENFWLVQLAQWAIFAFSAVAFWLGANLLHSEQELNSVVHFFLILGGALAIAMAVLGVGRVVGVFATIAVFRTPFWILISGLAGSQLLFNKHLSMPWRVFLLTIVAAVLVYAFVLLDERVSNWVGVTGVAATLLWLRYPRLRLPVVILLVLLLLSGLLFSFLYEFAGGDAKWAESGASRLILIRRVVEVTLRNPVTGLGPASYRPYANAEPLQYNRAVWFSPKISSHNNYIDMFAQTGLLGLGLFAWFLTELGLLGWRLHNKYREGFLGGYVNGTIAIWISALAIMLLLDWILPFVYNVGFPGFQASVLIWLFWGGLVAIEQWDSENTLTKKQ